MHNDSQCIVIQSFLGFCQDSNWHSNMWPIPNNIKYKNSRVTEHNVNFICKDKHTIDWQLAIDCNMKYTNVHLWEEAGDEFPQFTSEERLKPFSKLNLKAKEGIPKQFLNLCQAALDSTKQTHIPSSVKRDGMKAYFIKGTCREMRSSKMKEIIATLIQGAGLLMATVPEVSSFYHIRIRLIHIHCCL